MNCDAIASMPNSPMTREACEQMKASAMSMQGSMNDPAGMRPGDDDMTCDQIKAELMTQHFSGVSAAHAQEGQAAAKDFQAKNKQIQGEVAAAVVQETAVSEAANNATNAALDAHAKAVLTPAEQRMMSSTATSMNDVAQGMQSNPRAARLSSLAMRKNCRG